MRAEQGQHTAGEAKAPLIPAVQAVSSQPQFPQQPICLKRFWTLMSEEGQGYLQSPTQHDCTLPVCGEEEEEKRAIGALNTVNPKGSPPEPGRKGAPQEPSGLGIQRQPGRDVHSYIIRQRSPK